MKNVFNWRYENFWTSFIFPRYSILSTLYPSLSVALVQKKSTIGHFHDDVILLQQPEFISFSFLNSNFVIPGESKEQ